MKKLIILGGAFMFALAAVTFISASNSSAKSSLLLQNAEALAQREANPNCMNGCKMPTGICWCNGFQPYTEAR